MKRTSTLVVPALAFLLVLAVVGACRPQPPSAGKGTATPEAAAVRRAQMLTPPGDVAAALAMQDGNVIVASRSDNTYRVYDPLGGRLVRQFTAEPKPPPGFVVSPHENRAAALTSDQRYLLVANYRGHTVSVIDLASQQAIASIYTVGSPYRFQPDNAAVGLMPVIHDQGVTVLDLTRLEERETLDSEDLVYSPDGRTAYLLEGPQKTGLNPEVLVKASGTQDRRIDLGGVDPYDGGALALSPDGLRLYVLLAGRRLQVIETATGSVVKSIDVARNPPVQFLRLSPDGTALVLWAPERGAPIERVDAPTPPSPVFGQVFLVDTRTSGLTRVGESFQSPVNLAFSLDGKYLYVPDRGQGVLVLRQ